jgi:tryptophan-rich sensory protein
MASPAVERSDVSITRREPRRKRWLALAGFIGVSMAAGVIGSLFTSQSVATWYPTLTKPPLNPPSWVFGPVWTTLYALMGTSAWLIWQKRDRPGAKRVLGLFGAQLALNTAWSGLFFGLQSPVAGLVGILPLAGMIGAYTVSSWRISRGASALFWPYLGWVSFASYLNAGLWWLNR